jgi:osomolarity two-component system response regulator SKN7
MDTNEFTKDILPKHFKHSNFASFVRQLNKYDFHKVKQSTEERQQNEYGEGAWEFKHPDFRKHDREALETIKRKGPAQKRGVSDENQISNEVVNKLEDTVSTLKSDHKLLKNELKSMNQKYTNVIESIITLKSTNDRYFRSINVLVNSLINHGIKLPQLDLPPLDNFMFQNQIPNQQIQQQQQPLHRSSNSQTSIPTNPLPPTLASTGVSKPTPNHQREGSKTPPGSLRPGFHVLLVEDDNVCIQLCQKFLQKYGCTVEVVSDGLTAITALENSRYDIVFMDIIMPNLDGATATSIVRSFDNHTPIIAMTGNVNDQDLVTYLQHGLSDILAKPFTKDDLYLMLDKHLSNKTPSAYQQSASMQQTSIPQPQQPGAQLPSTTEPLQAANDFSDGHIDKRQKL